MPADPADLDRRPEANNLVGIYAALTDATVKSVLAAHAGQGAGAFKPALTDPLVALRADPRPAARSSSRPRRDQPYPRRKVPKRPVCWPRRPFRDAYRIVGLTH